MPIPHGGGSFTGARRLGVVTQSVEFGLESNAIERHPKYECHKSFTEHNESELYDSKSVATGKDHA